MTRETMHKTGIREECLKARLELLQAEKQGVATNWHGSGGICRGFGSTSSVGSIPTRGAPRWQTFSEGTPTCLLIT